MKGNVKCECGRSKPAARAQCGACVKLTKAARKGNIGRIVKMGIETAVEFVEAEGFEVVPGFFSDGAAIAIKPPKTVNVAEFIESPIPVEVNIEISDDGRIVEVESIREEPRFDITEFLTKEEKFEGFEFEDYIGGNAKPAMTWEEMTAK
jgi:hypothetical protein